MYTPAHFRAPGDEQAAVVELLDHVGAADLVTPTADGLLCTFLPLLHERATDGGPGTLRGHLARSNEQWRVPATGEALVVVHGPDAYVSPGWYPSTAEHGRVVPTWNYVTAHVYGRLVVHDDPEWTERLVRDLTVRHETGLPAPWSVDDAPPAHIAGQLRAIVGIEVVVSRVEAKWKLSQNRPAADVAGVIDALGSSASPRDHEVAAAMRAARDSTARDTTAR